MSVDYKIIVNDRTYCYSSAFDDFVEKINEQMKEAEEGCMFVYQAKDDEDWREICRIDFERKGKKFKVVHNYKLLLEKITNEIKKKRGVK